MNIRAVLVIACMPLFATGDSPAERAAISQLVAQLGAGTTQPALFTSEANIPAISRQLDRHNSDSPQPKPTVTIAPGVWREATLTFPPAGPEILTFCELRHITPDVITVDAVWAHPQAAPQQTCPVFIVVKKEGTQWRIADVKTVASPRQ